MGNIHKWISFIAGVLHIQPSEIDNMGINDLHYWFSRAVEFLKIQRGDI